VTLVRDAMVPEPRTLAATATAQEAGGLLERPEVRAVLVTEGDGRLVGVVTRKTLVREVVAAGRDPRATQVGAIAEPPLYTVEPELPLDEAYRFLEEQDAERVPVTEHGRLVGVLSRSALQRRLAEDEPPPDMPDAA
jgi:CBS domain-containing protein